MNSLRHKPTPLIPYRLESRFRYFYSVRWLLLLLLLTIIGWRMTIGDARAQAIDEGTSPIIKGQIIDNQEQPVFNAQISAYKGNYVLAEANSQDDGRFALLLAADASIPDQMVIRVEKHHFEEAEYFITIADLQS